jgi:hypothetical protein
MLEGCAKTLAERESTTLDVGQSELRSNKLAGTSQFETQALAELKQDPAVRKVGAIPIGPYTYLVGKRDCTERDFGMTSFVVLLGHEIEDAASRQTAIGSVSRLAAALREIASVEIVWSGVAETTDDVAAVSKGWRQLPLSWVR